MAWTAICCTMRQRCLLFMTISFSPEPEQSGFQCFMLLWVPQLHTPKTPLSPGLTPPSPLSRSLRWLSYLHCALSWGITRPHNLTQDSSQTAFSVRSDLCQSSLSHAFHQKTQFSEVPGPAGGWQAGSKAWQSQAATGQGVVDSLPQTKDRRRRICMFSPTKLQFLLKSEDIELNDL